MGLGTRGVGGASSEGREGTVTDDTKVDWVTTGGDIDAAVGRVLSCETAACKATTTMHSDSQSQPWRIIVDDKAIYWLNRGPGVHTSNSGSRSELTSGMVALYHTTGPSGA